MAYQVLGMGLRYLDVHLKAGQTFISKIKVLLMIFITVCVEQWVCLLLTEM